MIIKVNDAEKLELKRMHSLIRVTWQHNVDNCKRIYESKAAGIVHPELYKMILIELNEVNGACARALDMIEDIEEVGFIVTAD